MTNILFKFFGALMLIWYGALRWEIFADPVQYFWAYRPVNMATAFLSVVFIVPTLFAHAKTFSVKLLLLGVFLAFRNLYYTIVDIIDIPFNPGQQLVFIAIDLMMFTYCLMYIRFYKKVNS